MMFEQLKRPSGTAARRDTRPSRSAGWSLPSALLLMMAGAAQAADPPNTASTAGAISPKSELSLLPAPAEAMAAMEANLDKDANFEIANVAGQPITKGDVADVMRTMPVSLASLGYKALFTRAMDELLRQRLAAASAQKAGLDKDPVVRRREQSASERVLAAAWLDHQADAAVTETSLRARYDRTIAGKPGPEEVRARVILVPSEAEARNVIAKVQAGADFSDLARQYSKDLSANEGGDIGYAPIDALSAEVGAVLFALSPGQVTAYPVRALPGYFILRVEGRRQRATPTFDQARPMLTNELRHEAAAAAIQALTADIKVKDAGGPAKP
jgi:peptidyl-prolyl cis-trans isomerase C